MKSLAAQSSTVPTLWLHSAPTRESLSGPTSARQKHPSWLSFPSPSLSSRLQADACHGSIDVSCLLSCRLPLFAVQHRSQQVLCNPPSPSLLHDRHFTVLPVKHSSWHAGACTQLFENTKSPISDTNCSLLPNPHIFQSPPLQQQKSKQLCSVTQASLLPSSSCRQTAPPSGTRKPPPNKGCWWSKTEALFCFYRYIIMASPAVFWFEKEKPNLK